MKRKARNVVQPRILWLQVWSLSGVQGAFTLAWLIYNLYLPRLLTEWGFPESLAVGILMFENILAVVMEPLMGALSDRAKLLVGSRFPFISVGIILSSVLFIAIPSTIMFVPLRETVRLLLPGVAIAWALAMTVFRSPMLTLLRRYATPSDLPLAVSFVTLAGGLVNAFRFPVSQLILSLGPVYSFAIGSFALLGTASVLRWFHPPEQVFDRAQTWPIPGHLPRSLALILGAGVGIAWGSRLLMDVFSKLLKIQLNAENVDGVMFIINLTIAFAALPAGAIATKIGNRTAMFLGIGAISIILIAMLYVGAQMPLILLGIYAFSLIINGAIPLALSLVSPRWSGLAVGMYFAGFAVTASLFNIVYPQPQLVTPIMGVLISASAFLFTGVCIALSRSMQEF